VHAVVEGAHLDEAVDEPPEAGRQRGLADVPVAGVGDHDDVGLQQVLVRLEERGQRR
jgi:hypothetical protein